VRAVYYRHDNRSVYWDVPLSAEDVHKVVGMEVHLSGVLKGARECCVCCRCVRCIGYVVYKGAPVRCTCRACSRAHVGVGGYCCYSLNVHELKYFEVHGGASFGCSKGDVCCRQALGVGA